MGEEEEGGETAQGGAAVGQDVEDAVPARRTADEAAGLCFVDWDPVDNDAAGRAPNDRSGKRGQDTAANGANAVVHAWWQQVCDGLGVSSEIDLQALDKTFWAGRGYRLLPGNNTKVSPHATAALLCTSLPAQTQREPQALTFLNRAIEHDQVAQRMTPYFATFVAQALFRSSPSQAVRFIERHYGPLAAKYGTLQEKVSDGASLAHGWSIGFAPLLFTKSSA